MGSQGEWLPRAKQRRSGCTLPSIRTTDRKTSFLIALPTALRVANIRDPLQPRNRSLNGAPKFRRPQEAASDLPSWKTISRASTCSEAITTSLGLLPVYSPTWWNAWSGKPAPTTRDRGDGEQTWAFFWQAQTKLGRLDKS